MTTTGGAGSHRGRKRQDLGRRRGLDHAETVSPTSSLAIDYFNINVKDEVVTLGNHILNFCYDSEDFPNNSVLRTSSGRATRLRMHRPIASVSIINFAESVSEHRARSCGGHRLRCALRDRSARRPVLDPVAGDADADPVDRVLPGRRAQQLQRHAGLSWRRLGPEMDWFARYPVQDQSTASPSVGASSMSAR